MDSLHRYVAEVIDVAHSDACGADARLRDYELRIRVTHPFARAFEDRRGARGRTLVVRRQAPVGAFRPGCRVVLTAGESAALASRGEVCLESDYLSVTVVPHAGGRLASMRLKSNGFGALDARPVARVREGWEVGGVTAGVSDGPEKGLRNAGRAHVRAQKGSLGAVMWAKAKKDRLRQHVRLHASLPAAVLEVEVEPGDENDAPRLEAHADLGFGREETLTFLWPDRDGVENWVATDDPAFLHPIREFEIQTVTGLSAGAVVAARDDGATVSFFEPDAVACLELFGWRFRATERLRFRPQTRRGGVALFLAERVAVGPTGVAAAASALAKGGFAKVAIVLRDEAAEPGQVVDVDGREAVLSPVDLGLAGSVLATELALTPQEWQLACVRIRTSEGEYAL